MPFKELMDRLMKGEAESLQQLKETMASFIAALKEYHVDMVRLYVYKSDNYGHQATTVHLMRRFIELTGYRDTIQLAYEPTPGLPQKLALLIPGLDPGRIEEKDYTVNYHGATLTFFKLTGEPPGDEYQLGFTGGADNDDKNLAVIINVEGALRTQPYIWKKDFGAGDRKSVV